MNIKIRRGHFNLSTQISLQDSSIGLYGKSGAGKSTMLGSIAGTIQPHSGHIVMDGKTLFDSRKRIVMPRELRPVGAVLQADSLGLDETVRDHLTAAYHRAKQQRSLFKLDFLIALLEIGGILDQPLKLLSVAERQRVALGRALLKSPKLLLLDDTFATVGAAYRMQMLPILKRLQCEFNLSIVYASQSLGDILELTDQVVVLDQGKVIRNGSLRELARQQDFLRYLGIRQIDNILPVTIREHDYSSGCSLADSFGLPLMLPLRPHFVVGSRTQVSIRAKDIALSRRFIDGISIQNQLKGRICALIPSDDSVVVQIDCGGTLLAEITPGALHSMALQEGDMVHCLIKTHAIVYLAELDDMPYQRVVSHRDGYYYLSATNSGGQPLIRNSLA
ncbi:molybdenum ABC transporter ATP-binding protein [Methylomonas sp. MgM2]